MGPLQGFQQLGEVDTGGKLGSGVGMGRTTGNVQSHREALLWQSMGRWECWKAVGDNPRVLQAKRIRGVCACVWARPCLQELTPLGGGGRGRPAELC